MLKPGASQLDDISYLPGDTWQERLGPGMDGSIAGGTRTAWLWIILASLPI